MSNWPHQKEWEKGRASDEKDLKVPGSGGLRAWVGHSGSSRNITIPSESICLGSAGHDRFPEMFCHLLKMIGVDRMLEGIRACNDGM